MEKLRILFQITLLTVWVTVLDSIQNPWLNVFIRFTCILIASSIIHDVVALALKHDRNKNPFL